MKGLVVDAVSTIGFVTRTTASASHGLRPWLKSQIHFGYSPVPGPQSARGTSLYDTAGHVLGQEQALLPGVKQATAACHEVDSGG